MIQLILQAILKGAKTLWQFIFKYRGILSIIVILFLVWKLASRDNSPTPDNDEIALLRETLKMEKTRTGNQVAVLTQKAIDRDEFKKEASKYKKERDSLAYLLKIKPKWIKGATTVTNKIDTQFVEKVVTITDPVDSSETFVAEHHDPWIDISARLGRDFGTIKVVARDSPYIVYTERRPFLGKVKSEVRVFSSSPYIQQGTGYSYTVKPKKLLLTAGPGIGYDPFSRKVTFNFSVQVPVLKIYR